MCNQIIIIGVILGMVIHQKVNRQKDLAITITVVTQMVNQRERGVIQLIQTIDGNTVLVPKVGKRSTLYIHFLIKHNKDISCRQPRCLQVNFPYISL